MGVVDVIFEQENLAFRIKGVLLYEQNNYIASAQKHPDDTISFRFSADSTIENNGETLKLTDNSICFAPAYATYSGNLKNDKRIVIHFELLNYSSDVVQVYNPINPEKFAELFTRANECCKSKDAGYMHKMSAYLNLIFAELYAEHCTVKERDSKITNSIRTIHKNKLKMD